MTEWLKIYFNAVQRFIEKSGKYGLADADIHQYSYFQEEAHEVYKELLRYREQLKRQYATKEERLKAQLAMTEECADVLYTLIGLMVHLGITPEMFQTVLDDVVETNWKKVADGATFDEYGKVKKK